MFFAAIGLDAVKLDAPPFPAKKMAQNRLSFHILHWQAHCFPEI
jgi:hypothetical protein